ncbi:MAG TPA: hypothetical protein VIM69_11280 [Opitutaceae bacterium]
MNALPRELGRIIVVNAASRCGFSSVNAHFQLRAFQVSEATAIYPLLNI